MSALVAQSFFKGLDWRNWSAHEWCSLTDEDASELYVGQGCLGQVDAQGRHLLMAALSGGMPPRLYLKVLLLTLAIEQFARVMHKEDDHGICLAAYLVRYLPENVVLDRGCWVVLSKYSQKAQMTPVINRAGEGLLVQLARLAEIDNTPSTLFLQADLTSQALRLDIGQWQAGATEGLINAITANSVLTEIAPGHLPPSLHGASRVLSRLYYSDLDRGRADLWRPSVSRLMRVSEWVKMLAESAEMRGATSFTEVDRQLLETFEELRPDLRVLCAHMKDPGHNVVRSIMLGRRHHLRWAMFEQTLA